VRSPIHFPQRLGFRLPRTVVASFAAAGLSDGALAAQPDTATLSAHIDLVWVMGAAALVMMMQVGFLLLEAGMVRSKNSINVAQKNLLDFVFGVVAFAAVGFMVAFGSSTWLPFGLDSDFLFLRNMDTWQAGFFVFQVMFCGTAATIVSGAVAERMKLVAYVLGSVVLSALIYPIFVHWTWGAALGPNSGAFLGNLGFVDFAGSTVVHSTGGWISLAACMVIGPRIGRYGADGRPVRIAGHSPVLSTTGALLLFFGWIGFNGGSTLQASEAVAPIILNTVLAGGVGTCVGYVLGHIQDGIVLPEKSLSGMLGGLVAVTAGCHVLEPAGAMLIGAIGGLVAIAGNDFIERRLKIDDAVGAIGVHAFAGVAGTLLLALLAPVERLPAGSRFDQLYIQIFGAGLNFYWSFGLGYLFFAVLDRFMPIRVTSEVEEIGLNVSEHGSRLGIGHVEEALAGLVDGTTKLGHRLPVEAGGDAEKLTTLFNRLMDNIETEERAREELRALKRDTEEAERVTALANATFEAIVIHDEGRIVDGNKQLSELAGLPLEELIGRSIFEFLPPPDMDILTEAVAAGAELNREINLKRADGELVPIEARGREIVYRGKRMRIGCLVDLRERKLAESHIRYLALHDPLTGLPNRALFNEKLAESVAMARQGAGCAVVMVDIDHFKDINDLHGHPAGDAVIRETAHRLQQAMSRHDVAARLGGDEFAVILANVYFHAQVEDFCRRLAQAFRSPFEIEGCERLKCGVSIGAAIAPEHAESSEELVGRADIALYHAKNSGRNTYKIFKSGMNELIEKRRALEIDMDAALARGEFELFLQPRVSAMTAKIHSYEALLRWNHPQRGLVSPVDFVAVAEVSGKIIALGEWVIEEACRILAGTEVERLSINVSPLQFRHSDFQHRLGEIVRASGVDPRRIELEITESVLIDDDRRALQILKELKAVGFTIALDDFGTGYSSLSYLSRYPFDAIKIDRSFVSNLGLDESAAVIVNTIIDLGERLGIKVVAEGVETIEQALFLARAGCDELQGYLLGKPVALDERVRTIPASVAVVLTGSSGRTLIEAPPLAMESMAG
jgi:Amt family ammonium transporter